MAAIGTLNVKCGHCGTIQPSAIFIDDSEAIEAGVIYGNEQQCRSCHKMINCNRENISYVLADGSGGSMGGDYSGNKA